MEISGTKEKLLDVAERLFAENGISSTSLRKIIGEAGTNIASIHYHFGSKDELIKQVFARRFKPVIKKREEILDKLESYPADSPPAIEEIVRAIVGPILEFRLGYKGGKKLFLTLFAKMHLESDEVKTLVIGEMIETDMRFIKILGEALPHLSEEDVIWRFRFMIGTVFVSSMPGLNLKQMKYFSNPNLSVEDIAEKIIPFLVAGFNADPPKKTEK